MKHLFLTSTVEQAGVAQHIRTQMSDPQRLRTCLITTATETPEETADDSMLNNERQMLNEAGFATFDYSITNKSLSEIQRDLAHIDVLHISGGNEFYLKQQSNKNNFGQFVKQYILGGGVYIGSSCGSIIVGADMSPTLKLNNIDSLTTPIDTTGFGIVDFIVLPHWGSDNFRAPYLTESFDQMYHENNQLIAINNYCYVEVIDDQLRIVDTRI